MNTYLFGFVIVLLYLIIKDQRQDYDIFTFFKYIFIALTSWLGVIYFTYKYVREHKDEIKKFLNDVYEKYIKPYLRKQD